ncbi:7580_t:CDS:2 [Paraglomus brasilianum]|uniref:7580_t:CDS:1 n=1 Tax=Paraglomus brasilianum TaxID=144538 RepID=A0A9N9DNH6_9GLOM|nr:7580_t:CDS:2 [Paraglomus brasilianum]
MIGVLSSATLLKAAAILGASGIGLGAFGGHALKRTADSVQIETWQTAVMYQLIHAVAILTLASSLSLSTRNNLAGTLMLYGTLCFSGSLYLLVYTGRKFGYLGLITPIGGLLFIGGWLALLL